MGLHDVRRGDALAAFRCTVPTSMMTRCVQRNGSAPGGAAVIRVGVPPHAAITQRWQCFGKGLSQGATGSEPPSRGPGRLLSQRARNRVLLEIWRRSAELAPSAQAGLSFSSLVTSKAQAGQGSTLVWPCARLCTGRSRRPLNPPSAAQLLIPRTGHTAPLPSPLYPSAAVLAPLLHYSLDPLLTTHHLCISRAHSSARNHVFSQSHRRPKCR